MRRARPGKQQKFLGNVWLVEVILIEASLSAGLGGQVSGFASKSACNLIPHPSMLCACLIKVGERRIV